MSDAPRALEILQRLSHGQTGNFLHQNFDPVNPFFQHRLNFLSFLPAVRLQSDTAFFKTGAESAANFRQFFLVKTV